MHENCAMASLDPAASAKVLLGLGLPEIRSAEDVRFTDPCDIEMVVAYARAPGILWVTFRTWPWPVEGLGLPEKFVVQGAISEMHAWGFETADDIREWLATAHDWACPCDNLRRQLMEAFGQ